ncbi:putative alpha/beta hydrolase family protein DUF2235 [Actinocorallia herbida]|uniref:Putative alpha/beta hydrolase family protein DUF2235 n=1 Tax=Actinocorallia herbida TaxID=58109 RepID=A0A3N1CXT7_9ACTN|nr:DUF2235 domain-containing protein [Actinocorallia herbida]ROO86056.1 putative alpha/beta hydrolase family protein DUF2235 [Actinocorallia herbida]
MVQKRLIACCDGTWNTADQAVAGQSCPTNITKLALSVAPRDPLGTDQRVYYHGGVGTERKERLRGGAFGVGLSRNVLDAYRFLIDNYEPGDSLFFFGFSRGAFTARSLAGLVRNSGVLRRENAGRIDEAWTLYRNAYEKPSGMASTLFRQSYAHEPRIRFLGMFDTVGTRGVPTLGPRWLSPVVKRLNRRWEFHDTTLSSLVDGAFHALAIDEQRSVFEPTLWHQQPDSPGQELRQVWFTGVHCDIGGGYRESGLSDLSLLWMADRAREYGLHFLPDAFSPDGPAAVAPGKSIRFATAPDAMGPLHPSRNGLYRLVDAVDRAIGAAVDDRGRPDGNEYLAMPAEQRYGADPRYRPGGLVTYLKDPSRVRLEPVLESPTPVNFL